MVSNQGQVFQFLPGHNWCWKGERKWLPKTQAAVTHSKPVSSKLSAGPCSDHLRLTPSHSAMWNSGTRGLWGRKIAAPGMLAVGIDREVGTSTASDLALSNSAKGRFTSPESTQGRTACSRQMAEGGKSQGCRALGELCLLLAERGEILGFLLAKGRPGAKPAAPNRGHVKETHGPSPSRTASRSSIIQWLFFLSLLINCFIHPNIFPPLHVPIQWPMSLKK